MLGLSRIKTISNRFKNFILATAFVATQLTTPLILSGHAAAAGPITFGAQFENQVDPNDPNDWGTGQLDNYSEGDYVNFRFQLTGASATSAGTMQIEYDLGSCHFFTNYFNFVSATPNIATVTEGANTLNGSGNNQYYAQKLNVAFNTAGTTTVIFTLQLSNTAGECNGANTAVRLNVPSTGSGDFANAGAKSLPMSANEVLENPSLTITKTVSSGTASPDDFYFTVSPAITGIIDGVSATRSEIHLTNGTVTITEVNPDGQFVITEHGPAGYSFSGGTGTNCSVTSSGVMTATVTADETNPADATCNFTNTRSTGSLKIVKNVINDNGGTKTYSDFHFSVDGGASQSFNADATDTNGEDGVKTLSLPTGTYSVTEPEENKMGYATSYKNNNNNNCTDVEVVAGQTTICTITNDDVAPSLTLNKVVTNDNGGTAAESAWTIDAVGASQSPTNLSGPGAAGDADVTSDSNFKADTYTLSESGDPSGYAASNWTCTNNVTVNENSQITLTNGQTTVCTITNNDIAPTLTLRKVVSNPYGGSGVATADLWTLRAQHEQDNPLINMTGSLNNDDSASTTSKAAMAGIAYDLSESGPAGYNASNWSCTAGGTVTNGDQVTLSLGKDVTCTITNTQMPASISGHKYKVDENGDGTTGLQDWTIYLLVSGNPIAINHTTTDSNGYYEFTGLAWGDYTLAECLGQVTESYDCTQWTQIYSPPTVSLNGDDLTSYNNDFGNFKNGSISGYKFNDLNGDGVRQENEPTLPKWPFSYVFDANGDRVFDESAVDFKTDQDGNFTLPNLAPGKYQICEDPQTELGWVRTAPVSSNCRTRTISTSDQTITGLVFGNQAQGTIVVNKDVVNDNGNAGTYQDFSFDLSSSSTFDNSVDVTGHYGFDQASGGDSNDGTKTVMHVPAGTYRVTETNANSMGYTTSYSNNCANMVVTAGQTVTCTITNDDVAPSLTLIKYVVNDNSGQNEADDWILTAAGPTSISGAGGVTSGASFKAGLYTLSEEGPEGYDASDWSCRGDGTQNGDQIQLGVGESATCTITNNDIAHPRIHIVKEGPAVAHEGDTITFTGTITNTGDAPLNIVGIEDDVAGAVVITSDVDGHPVGDNNDNNLLDVDETWTATVDYVVPNGQLDNIVNTMTVCADDATSQEVTSALFFSVVQQEGELTGDTCNSDNHTTDVLHPAINVVKSGKNSAPAGTTVTYTFTVTNTGDTPVAVDSVIDTIAGDGVYQSGDVNNNSLLDMSETWVYTANYKIPSNQITNVNNTVTVCASDQLERQVCDSDSHSLTIPKVLGASTELPNTGQSPIVSLIAGLSFIGLAIAARWLGRKPQGSTL